MSKHQARRISMEKWYRSERNLSDSWHTVCDSSPGTMIPHGRRDLSLETDKSLTPSLNRLSKDWVNMLGVTTVEKN